MNKFAKFEQVFGKNLTITMNGDTITITRASSWIDTFISWCLRDCDDWRALGSDLGTVTDAWSNGVVVDTHLPTYGASI